MEENHNPTPESESGSTKLVVTTFGSDWKSTEMLFFVIIFGFLSFIGLVMNARLLISLFSNSPQGRNLPIGIQNSRRKNPLTISLCLADLIICAISIPVTLIVAVVPPISWSNAGCKIIFFLQIAPISCSAMSQMIVSLDRYTTIEYPRIMLQLHRTSVTMIISVIIWVVSAFVILPEILNDHIQFPFYTRHTNESINYFHHANISRTITSDELADANREDYEEELQNRIIKVVGGYVNCVNRDTDNSWHQFYIVLYLIISHMIPMAVVLLAHIIVRAKLTALSLTARAKHGEFPLPIPLLRRPAHVIIVTGVATGTNQHNQVITNTIIESKKSRRKRPTRNEKIEMRRQNNHELQPSIDDEDPRPTSSLNSRRRLGNCLVVSAVLFNLFWLPHVLLTICLEFDADLQIHDRYYLYCLMFGYLNSIINPIIATTLFNTQQTITFNWSALWPCPTRFVNGLTRRSSPPASSTNEAALGPFHPRYIRPQNIQNANRRDDITINSMQNLY